MRMDIDMQCLYCKKEGNLKKYKAFHWSSGGGHIIKGLFNYIHPACYQNWYDKLISGLAELDGVMDYCEFFQRSKGREGAYVREGKSFPVRGDFDRYHLDCPHSKNLNFLCCEMQPFSQFLKMNGWIDSWFILKEKYRTPSA